jgi:ParB-like chromosome segregation protein Spo0J
MHQTHEPRRLDKPGGPTLRVPVPSLVPSDSPRIDGEDERHISLLAQLETQLPPILVQRGTMRVVDGMHRLRAAISLGHGSVDIKYFEGTDAEAFIAAVKANIDHGLPLTRADREAAAARIIELYPERSDRWIADITGLARGTVAGVRRTQADDPQGQKRVGRDGRVRPFDSTDGRRMAMNAINAHPDASLRVIARMTGVSPETVRKVRRRMLSGEDPIARKQSRNERLVSLDGQALKKGCDEAHPKDRGVLLQKLRGDPSLRFTETGRRLLRWLEVQAAGPAELYAMAEIIPPHCAYHISKLASGYADEWQEVADQLQRRAPAVE